MTSPFHAKYGPWALVAGASEGLGAAWANALAARGLNLVLLARRQDALDATATAIRAKHTVEVVTHAIDLGSANLVEALTPAIATREIGLLVCNAASTAAGPFLERTTAAQQLSLDVNCRTPLTLAHHFGGLMAKRGRGGIVLMSSLTAFQGTPLLATYGATKAFNLALAEALHVELRPLGVDVLACCAGATRTPNYLKSAAPEGAPGELDPAQVVDEALASLGHTGMMIPGAFNRFASFLMRRLMPRSMAVNLLANQAKKLRLSP